VASSVLAIGLDPIHVDFSAFPDLTPDRVRAYVSSELNRLREDGFRVTDCLISPDEQGLRMVEYELNAMRYAGVLIGAGLREPPTPVRLFECVINLVHSLAPDARICFNSSPADTTEAVRRWISPAVN
jgi:hypothetical protein